MVEPPQTTQFSKFEMIARRKCTWYFCHTFLCNWFGEFYVYFDDEGCWSHPFPHKNKKQHDRKANSNVLCSASLTRERCRPPIPILKCTDLAAAGWRRAQWCGSSMAGSWVAAKDGLHIFKRRTNGLWAAEKHTLTVRQPQQSRHGPRRTYCDGSRVIPFEMTAHTMGCDDDKARPSCKGCSEQSNCWT